MARLVGAFNMSHTPFCYVPPEHWNSIRAARALRADVPGEDLDECRRKAGRIQSGLAALRQKLTYAKLDVLVIFGDDQRYYLDFDNYPSLAVYVGAEFQGILSDADLARYLPSATGAGTTKKMKGHPGLATGLLTGLKRRGFDPAFMMDPMTKPDIGHAFMRPAESLTDYTTPTIPIMVNCYFAPQITAQRSYQLGRAVRAVIDDYPADLRVGVLGSGGLWHTPGAQEAYLDEEFDRQSLRYLEEGDIRGAVEFFDGFRVPAGDRSQPVGERGPTSTGLPAEGGPQGGTREFCNWIATCAVAEGAPSKVIDYVPVYASPCGVGFTYCEGLA